MGVESEIKGNFYCVKTHVCFHGAEEVVLPSKSVIFPAGIINDESNNVGRVHLALVYVIEITKGNVHIRAKEKGVLRGELYSIDQLSQLSGKMESWTQLLIDQGLDSL
jgi:predicted NUDIX family phosphoesterase